MNIRAIGKKIHGTIGAKINGFQFMIDVISACSSKCPSCPVGVFPVKGGHKMTLDTFKRILDKAEGEFKIRKVQLYRWSDPLLHPLIHEFAIESESRGHRTSVSSDLQATTCDFPKLMMSGISEFRVSFSGWKHMRYYQRPATPEKFFKKFDYINSLPCHPSTVKSMFFHRYKDNLDEEAPAKKIAEDNGYQFQAFDATYMMYERIVYNSYLPEDEEILSRFPETPEENIARFRVKPRCDDYCSLQEKEIVLDSHGIVKQCQLMGYQDEFNRGNFLTEPHSVIRKRIKENPMCRDCKATGVPTYSLIFDDPAKNLHPLEEFNRVKYIGGKL